MEQIKKHFIAIDGLDGSGKGTQTELLAKKLQNMGLSPLCLSFPDYDSEASAPLRMYLRGEFGERPEDVNAYAASSLFAVDRYASFKKSWSKDYSDGRIIIANRYTTANAVHQLSKLPKKEWDSFLSWLFEYEFQLLGLPVPDRVIYLSLSPEMVDKLIETRCRETGALRDIHERNAEHLKKSYEAAHYAAEKWGWVIIECEKAGIMRSREEIHNELFEKCSDILF